MPDYKASLKHAKITARKARLVVDLVRGLDVNQALIVLDRAPQRAAALVRKIVRSAVANAEQSGDVDLKELCISEARVDEGPLLGGYVRWRPAARGRAMPYRKRTSHIHIALSPVTRAPAAAVAAPESEPAAEPTKDD